MLEQLDILGEEVVPVLRREFAALKPAHVPDAPTHASLVAAAGGRSTHRDAGHPGRVTGQAVTRDADPHPRRRQRGAVGAVVDPAAGRPARRRDRRRPCASAGRSTPTVEVVELREHARDLADNLVTGFPNASLRAALDTVVGADGLIAVTPIFSASYSGLFKTFFDVVDKDALSGKPVLLGATAGTARHSLALEHALRPLFAYLRTVVVPTGGASRRRRTGARATRRTVTWPGASSVPRASSPTSSRAVRRPRRPTRSPTATPFEALLRGA